MDQRRGFRTPPLLFSSLFAYRRRTCGSGHRLEPAALPGERTRTAFLLLPLPQQGNKDHSNPDCQREPDQKVSPGHDKAPFWISRAGLGWKVGAGRTARKTTAKAAIRASALQKLKLPVWIHKPI